MWNSMKWVNPYSNWNRASSSGTQSFSPNLNVFGRNLRKYQLGGVIFGCNDSTMEECLSKQLFGLPAQHWGYVKNIEPGLPLFLFNYTDRKLHGVFAAASKGKLLIDHYAWTDGSVVTQFPAQVQICVQCRCQPLAEDKFKPMIAENYYLNHFWFELDHEQTNKLISSMKPLPISPNKSVQQNTQSITPFPFVLLDDPWGDDEPFKMPESELGFNEDDLSANGYTQPLDIHAIENERVKQDERDMIFMKLKEPDHPRENQDFSWEDYVNNICVEEEYSETQLGLEKEENPSSPFKNQCIIAQLEQEVKELTSFKETQTERNNYLEQKLMEALSEIQVIQALKDRLSLLESTCNIAHIEETVTNPSAELHLDPKDSMFLIGGSDGE